MAGTKRTSDEAGATTNTRASKTAKKDAAGSPVKASKAKAKTQKKAPKTVLPASDFQAHALPLHVNITHTPPSIPDEDTTTAAPADPGFLGHLSLLPSTFSTGSYGWKGTKHITVELMKPNAMGEMEKVQVILSINATVKGSKPSKAGADKKPAKKTKKAEQEEEQEDEESSAAEDDE